MYLLRMLMYLNETNIEHKHNKNRKIYWIEINFTWRMKKLHNSYLFPRFFLFTSALRSPKSISGGNRTNPWWEPSYYGIDSPEFKRHSAASTAVATRFLSALIPRSAEYAEGRKETRHKRQTNFGKQQYSLRVICGEKKEEDEINRKESE